jgi:hypothetical protein
MCISIYMAFLHLHESTGAGIGIINPPADSSERPCSLSQTIALCRALTTSPQSKLAILFIIPVYALCAIPLHNHVFLS